jgi:DNA primase
LENNWIDFKAVKAMVTMQMAIEHYKVNGLRKSGDELRGRCPIHEGDGAAAFHVSLKKNAFHCFSCKAKGNVLDFVAAMEKCSVREAAFRMADWFALGDARAGDTGAHEGPATGAGVEAKPESNKPLKFQLKGLDHAHPYLRDRGVSSEVAERFGIGYFSGRGSMAGRVVIPIHNEQGELVAYAGRAIDDSEPRYKLPAGFHKSQELYNLHRTIAESNQDRRVVLVEGFFDCIKLSTAGFAGVALMGSFLSEAQERALGRYFDQICVLMDGDAAGKEAAKAISQRLMRRIYVRVVDLPEGKQPDQLSTDELGSMLRK